MAISETYLALQYQQATQQAQAALTVPAFQAWLQALPDSCQMMDPLETYLDACTSFSWVIFGHQAALIGGRGQGQFVLPAWTCSVEQRICLGGNLTPAMTLAIVERVLLEEAEVPDAVLD